MYVHLTSALLFAICYYFVYTEAMEMVEMAAKAIIPRH